MGKGICDIEGFKIHTDIGQKEYFQIYSQSLLEDPAQLSFYIIDLKKYFSVYLYSIHKEIKFEHLRLHVLFWHMINYEIQWMLYMSGDILALNI